MSKHLPHRRAVIVQLASIAVLAACADTSNPPGPELDPVDDDTGEPTGEDGGGEDGSSEEGGGDDTGGGGVGGETGDDTGDVEEPEPFDRATCDQGDQPVPDGGISPTSTMGEGPYFRDDLPERDDLDVLQEGATVLIITGRLMTSSRNPVAGAKVCLWHADDGGVYDVESDEHHLYGYQVTAEDGTFCFRTSRPGPYKDFERDVYMPAHLHWKVFEGEEDILITQHTFEDDPWLENAMFPDSAILPVETLSDGSQKVRVDFILPASYESSGG